MSSGEGQSDTDNDTLAFSETKNDSSLSWPTPDKPYFNFGTQDKISHTFLMAISAGVVGLLLVMITMLFYQASGAIEVFGLKFLTSAEWNPLSEQFGGLSFIYGTLLTSFLALLIAAPISILVALFLQEVCAHWLGNFLGILVEMIAAIPSIVFGLWGLFFLVPFVRESLSPFLRDNLGFLPFFQGPSFGIGYLTASLILAIMIIPTITSMTREVFKVVPSHQKEAALAIGATRFEMIKLAVLFPSLSGMTGAMVLGLGRALGETMAVAMVIGNAPNISASLFAPGATMASVIANEYAEAGSDLHISALCLVGLVLFIITFIINFIARGIVWHFSRMQGGKK